MTISEQLSSQTHMSSLFFSNAVVYNH